MSQHAGLAARDLLAVWRQPQQPVQSGQTAAVGQPGSLGRGQFERADELVAIQAALAPDGAVLDEDRQLERPVGQPGVLEVDNPYPLAIPEEVGKGAVAMAKDPDYPGPAGSSSAVRSRVGVAVLAR